jgi:hypothetical protein
MQIYGKMSKTKSKTRHGVYVLNKNLVLVPYKVSCGKAVIFKYFDCMSVGLVTEHAQREHHIVFCSVACWLYHIPSRFLMKRKDLLFKVFERSVCFHFCLQILSESFLILKIIQEDIINVFHK